MSEVFIGRQPIFDKKKKLFAYELLFRSGQQNAFPGIDGEVATSSLLSTSFFTGGIDRISSGKLAFINFPEEMLLSGVASLFPKESIVVEILETVSPTPEVVAVCRTLVTQGYRLALDDFVYNPDYDEILKIVDIVKIDFIALSLAEIEEHVEILKGFSCTLLAEKIESYEDFKIAEKLGFTYFQGYFFARPEIIKKRDISASHRSLLRLVTELHKMAYDVTAIENIIKVDVGISLKLLNFLNSAYFSRLSPLSSIRQAVVFLGERGVRQFITLIVASKIAENKPVELARLAVIGARFLQNIGKELCGNDEEYFLLGLFSLIDAMLDCTMEYAMSQLPVSLAIRDALLKSSGPLYPFLKLVKAYESADWFVFTENSSVSKIDSDRMLDMYVDAIEMTDNFF